MLCCERDNVVTLARALVNKAKSCVAVVVAVMVCRILIKSLFCGASGPDVNEIALW